MIDRAAPALLGGGPSLFSAAAATRNLEMRSNRVPRCGTRVPTFLKTSTDIYRNLLESYKNDVMLERRFRLSVCSRCPRLDTGCGHAAPTDSSRSGRSVALGEAHVARDHCWAPHHDDRMAKSSGNAH